MFDKVKNQFYKINQEEEEKEMVMVKIVKRNIYDCEKDELVMLVREDFSKDVCKLLNKENDRDKYFYQIIKCEVDCSDFED